MTTRPEHLLTDAEVAARLRLPVRRVQTLALRGSLPGFKVGKAWRFRPSALALWEQQQQDLAAADQDRAAEAMS